MKRIATALSLLLATTLCHAGNDIWSALFKGKLREAGRGDSQAQYDVGAMYQNGRGVAPDRDKAMEWYRKAAAQHNQQAVSRLKLMQENKARFDKALAQAGKGDPEVQYDLGNMYLMGVGVEIDYAQAINAFEQAAGQGSDKAAYKLGVIYYEGTGVRADPRTAFKWFGQAAHHGLPAAQYYYGKLYAEGKGTSRNNKLALEWLSKAVDSGFEQARGEMINVTENIDMEKSAAAAQAPQPVPPPPPGASTRPPPHRKTRVAKPDRTASKAQAARNPVHYRLDDLMQGAWNRGDEPVTYLPSSINHCRTEDHRLVCFSDDQSSRTGHNIIRFKTKAIVDHFSTRGKFTVTYRNLVIEATPLSGTDAAAGDDAGMGSYTVKTGWGTPHTLECTFHGDNALSCVKNNSYTLRLSSQRALASGK
jgi:TPR repeat protein